MNYGRLGSNEPSGSSRRSLTDEPINPPQRRKCKLKFLLILASTLIIASAISAAIVVGLQKKSDSTQPRLQRRPSQAISRACSQTRYRSLCVNSLLDFPGATTASDQDLVHISVNLTLQHFGRALYVASEISNLNMDMRVRSAYEDCIELLDDSVYLLSRSLTSVGGSAESTQDIMTWLSAALSNQDTCNDGFEQLNGYVKTQMSDRLKDLSELVSNCLAIFAGLSGMKDFSGVPVHNRRRRLLNTNKEEEIEHGPFGEHKKFPRWLSKRDRMLLDAPPSTIRFDIIVSKDGNGTYKTIAEAIKKVPEYSSRRFIIYVKAGKYEEKDLKVGRKKTNVMFIGEGKGKTVIAGGRSVQDNFTTFHTAAFAATGAGFVVRDMTFENYAGPSKHQAVALRIGADHAVVYRCNIIGYQDTLYVHSQRQFYRECDVYGTVDFIFGNAAVVFQNCTLHARKPLPSQKITITAQNRKDPNQNTGISIHACRVVAEPDLEQQKGAFPTYLGRPWKMYARTIYMLSYLGDHIHPRGWLEWNTSNFALDTLYYGEYMNSGPGSALGQRVKWPGYHIINSTVEASRFTVAQFIYGSAWLPGTGVAFLAGLST